MPIYVCLCVYVHMAFKDILLKVLIAAINYKFDKFLSFLKSLFSLFLCCITIFFLYQAFIFTQPGSFKAFHLPLCVRVHERACVGA